jgi:uncharacterized membrane protein YeiH
MSARGRSLPLCALALMSVPIVAIHTVEPRRPGLRQLSSARHAAQRHPAVLLLRHPLPLPLLRLRGGLIKVSLAAMPQTAVEAPLTKFALYLGTLMSAISGCISAGTKEMDLLGCIVVALVNAAGGGTIRDVMLNRTPFWISHDIHLHIAIWTSAITFLIWPMIVSRGFKDTHLAFLWSDALAMAASTVIGTHIGLQETDNWLIGVLSGMCTATFGGIGRDILCQEQPRALYAERSMYATPAVVGAFSYAALQLTEEYHNIPDWLLLVVPFALTLALRTPARGLTPSGLW